MQPTLHTANSHFFMEYNSIIYCRIIYGLVVVKSTGLHAYFRKDAANLSASGSLGFWKKKNKINRNDPLLTIFICSSINKTLNPAPNFACLPSVHNAFSHVKLNHFF